MVDVIINLHDSESTDFTSNGLGSLGEALSCKVTEELNGVFELEMKYPVTGLRYNDLKTRNIIFCKPNPYTAPQAFRIYAISKVIKGAVTYHAEHISYDLIGLPLSPFTAQNAIDAMSKIPLNCPIACPFEFTTNKEVDTPIQLTVPTNIRKFLAGMKGSVLDIYRGEYEFDNYKVILHTNRGADRGVVVAYGKNLTDFQQEENCSSVYTGVYPYWYSEEEGLIELPEKIVYAEGEYLYHRIMPLDFSTEWDEVPTEDELRERAVRYMDDNQVGVPEVNIEVSFISLAKTSNYSQYASLERIRLGDTVHVQFPKMNVMASAKCVKTVYDVLTDRYIDISLGTVRNTLANTIAEQNIEIEDTAERAVSYVEQKLDYATKEITGAHGGNVILHSSTGGSKPDELLILDSEVIGEAVNVWRFNYQGLGISNNGYNGPFNSAWLLDGTLDMQQINVVNLVADLIKGGTLKLGSADNESGLLEVYDGSNNLICVLDKDGVKVYGNDQSYVVLNNEDGFAGYDRNGTKLYWAAEQNFHMRQAVVENEFTLSERMRYIPITTENNRGIGLVPYIEGVS